MVVIKRNKMKENLSFIKRELCDFYAEIKKDSTYLFGTFRNKYAKEINTKLDDQNGEANLISFLPYLSFDPKYNVFENHSTQGFILRTSHFSGINERAKNSLKNILANDIPAGMTVQIINYASPRIGNILDYWFASGSKGDIYKKITEKRLDFFKKGSWQSILGNKQNFVVRDFELYFCFSIAKALTDSGKQENLFILKALQEKIIDSFKGIGSNSYILDDIEFASFLREILTPSLTLNKEQILEKKFPIKDYFRSDNLIEMCKNEIKFGNFHYSTFEITDFPDIWNLEGSINYIGQFDTGISIPCPFYISYGFTFKTSEDSERIASKYRMIKTQQGDSKLPMFFPRMLEEINDWRYVTERINEGEKLGKAVMYVVILASSKEQKEKSEAVLRDHFAKLKFGLEKINYDTVNNFLISLPFNIAENWQVLDQLKIPSTILSGSCMNLMPVFADLQNYQNPLMLFVGRRGQIFFFDNFKTADSTNGNFNMVIVGNSGRGKSVWLQEYTTAILRSLGQVIIIDDGRSFKNTCSLQGGDFVDFGGGEFCINPFSLYREKKGFEDQKEYKEYFAEPFIDLIVSILCIIINIDKNNNDSPEIGKYRTVLENAAFEVMVKKGNLGGFSDIRDELLNNDKIRSSQTKNICDDIEYILRKYSGQGRYAKYFNGKSTLDIKSDFTVFELSDLQHNLILQNAVLMTVVFLVYAKMQGRERRTALVIDEFWRLGTHHALKEPIEGFARRGRKYNLSLILASQCMSDFSKENSSAGSAALAQSDWRIMMSVDGKDDQMLKDELKMTSAEIEIANGLSGLAGSYSEFMIRHKNNSWQIGRLLLDPFSAKLFSTKAEDVVAIKKMRDKGLPIEEAIERLG